MTELTKEPLLGSVKLYHRHLVVCTGPVEWPAKIEADGGFLQTLATAMARRAAELIVPTKLTACDEPGSGSGHDILVFPDNIRYVDLQEADLEGLVKDHLVGDRASDRLVHAPIKQAYVFVCIHGRRDLRCGECGPPLLEAFAAALADHDLTEKVVVRGTSHVGGHKYAGNVLIYPHGDWYGYVSPADVPRLIEQHLIQGQIVTDLWRGRMGLTPAQQVVFVGL